MSEEELLFDLENIITQKKQAEYDAVIMEKASYPYLYHLSAIRANILDWIPMEKTEKVLELNAGCGALTGALLEKAGQVVAVTETGKQADLIRKRYAWAGKRLTVVSEEDFWIREKQEFHKIFLIGQTLRFCDTIKGVQPLLAEGGRLYFADANRLGLKYFAGCQDEYREGYFAGIEGEDIAGEKHCYTRKEYEEILKEAGFTEITCYYPYPDYKFPTGIYSDLWLPKQGELGDNQRNYDKDRYRLFDEGKAFDTIIKEGLFPELANAFLFEAGTGVRQERERVIYSRHSNERAAQFQIRTDILEQPDKTRRVMKYAGRKEGIAHIAAIETSCQRLKEGYKDENISFCGCHREGEGIAFDYLEGKTLQELLEQALQEKQNVWIEKMLKDYCARIRACGGNRKFELTGDFCRVFGRYPGMEKVLETLDCPQYCDVDLIFSNILVAAECGTAPEQMRWQIIDYEWSFGFPVPKSYVLYRAMYFACYQIFNGTGWTLPGLLELAEITKEQQELFLKMEQHFQEYLAGDGFPVRNIQRLMGTRIYRLGEKKEDILPEFGLLRGLYYHIDREEYQDGCIVCSGWALARDWKNHGVPLELSVWDGEGKQIPAEITRTVRKDVAGMFELEEEKQPEYGFDCIFPLKSGEKWQITFARGHRKKRYRSGDFSKN